MKKKTSIRIDEDKLDKLNSMGITLTNLMEEAISKAIKEKKCPVCNQKVRIK